jgi:Family of unknown function (DUF6134)
MLRQLALSVALLSAAPLAFAADGPYPPQINYAIYRQGQQIGRHTVTFEHKGPVKIVKGDCEVEVRALGVAAYRYSYRSQEEWNGDQLQSLRATTDDNGKRFTVAAERREGSLVVERTASAPAPTAALADQGYQGPDVSHQVLPGSLLPTSGWNFGQVKQNTLLNTENGKVAHVQVTPAGRETVQMPSGSVLATRYRYTGDLQMDQWFDDKGRWVKGTFTAFDGSTIEYILQQ